ncbi:MAG: peptide-N(4)-(N-acetyl-beta-glucosaminyl)asparagine amidase [Candidatus Eremiobacteraeota bacterium]|nr:peptide-N(4)-(N-acetyl-beta-glucosaminyl)asparagine amidase [Candidatus Eremiobacteraeota bacterium]
MRLSFCRSFSLVAFSVSIAVTSGCAGQSGFGSGVSGVPGGTSAAAVRGPLSISRAAARVHALAGNAAWKSPMAHGGAGYPVTAVPRVKVPNESPCVDVLFTPHTPPLTMGDLPVGKFADYKDHPFIYTPPANCPGPYAKIVMRVHFKVSAGVQYDRTGAIWVGATNIFFGTTAEPSPTASPEWTVERDVTEYAPIFGQGSTGQASVYNIVNSQYTGIIYGRAELDFYPATSQYPPAKVADAIYPLSGGPTGGYVFLNSASSQMTGTFTFPTNVEAAYLDVFLESQSSDEFWYTCFPNNLAQQLNNCGNTAFREGDVTLDGQPAGVAPVYPRIYSGGIDPYLWVPIPGVETLNFVPYRIDLTPFAGQLDDGKPHTIAVAVFNDNNYFSANAALLVYQDHGSSVVTGRLVSDGTPVAPSESVAEHVKTDKSGTHGTIDTRATHPVSLSGYVMTSKGRVDTRVDQSVHFSNAQKINVTSSQFLQDIVQQTTVASDTITTRKGHSTRSREQRTWPLTLNYDYVASSSSATQTAAVSQSRDESGTNGTMPWALLNAVQSSDTLTFTPSGFTPSNGRSRQHYHLRNYAGFGCYDQVLRSLNYTIVSGTRGC